MTQGGTVTNKAVGQFCVQGVVSGTKSMKRKGLRSFPRTKQENYSDHIPFVELEKV